MNTPETLLKDLIGSKVTHREAQLCIEVAEHAVEEATKAIARVTEGLPTDQTKLIGLICAYALLAGHCERTRKNWNMILQANL